MVDLQRGVPETGRRRQRLKAPQFLMSLMHHGPVSYCAETWTMCTGLSSTEKRKFSIGRRFSKRDEAVFVFFLCAGDRISKLLKGCSFPNLMFCWEKTTRAISLIRLCRCGQRVYCNIN